MYFGPAVEGLFTVGASLLPLILRLKKQKDRKEKYQPGGISPTPLKPDAVLHSLKPQSTLQRGETKWQSPWKCIMWTRESPFPLHAASRSD